MRPECLAPRPPVPDGADADPSLAPPLALPDRPSIAVLPFLDESGDFEAQAFADGVTDHITYTLACIRGLFVSGRNSAFACRGRRPGVREVARRLGVAHVLEGTIRHDEERIEIAACLSDAISGRPLWRERLAGAPDELFRLQGALVARTVATLAPGLPFDPNAIERTRLSADIGIYAKFLAAYANYVAGTEECLRAMLASLAGIAEHAPDHPMPPALLAQAYAHLVVQGWSRDVEADAAEGTRRARAALALMAEETPAVMSMAGHALSVLARDSRAALALLDRALALNPNSAAGHERRGWVLCHAGRPEAALAPFRAALRLSPLDSTTFRFESGLGLALAMAGEPEAALPPLRRAMADAPAWTSSHRTLAASLALLGHSDEARALADELRRREPAAGTRDWLRPFADSAGRRRLVEGLRLAGLRAD